MIKIIPIKNQQGNRILYKATFKTPGLSCETFSKDRKKVIKEILKKYFKYQV